MPPGGAGLREPGNTISTMPLLKDDSSDDVRVTVWQCIGCGKIEYPQPCIGVCQDRLVDLVYDHAYQAALEEASVARQRAERLAAVLRTIAFTTPRDGQWEQSWRALQRQARELLGSPGDTD